MPNATISERIERRILAVAGAISGVTRSTRWNPIPSVADGTEEYRHLQVVVAPQSDSQRNNVSGVVGCAEYEKTVQVAVVIVPSEAGSATATATLRTRWIGNLRATFNACNGRLTESGGTVLTVDMNCEEDNTGEIADGVTVAAITLRIIYRTSMADPDTYDTLITAQA